MELDNDQQVIVDQLINNYKKNYGQLLPAMTGFGKGRIAVSVALHMYHTYNLQPFIVAPKTLLPMWEELFKQINITPLYICSYSKLANCNHPYITYKNNKFVVTKEWTSKKIFLICDESQSVKNSKTKKHWALFSLIQSKNDNKVLNLTASPIDKDTHWVCLYRNLGLITKKYFMIANGGNVKYENYGLGELLTMIKNNDKPLYRKIKDKFEYRPKYLKYILAYMWKYYFKHTSSIKVIDPIYKHPITNKPFTKTLTNLFATLDKEGREEFDLAIECLKEGKVIVDGKVVAENIGRKIGLVQKTLVKICASKINTIVRLVIDKLTSSSNKVIVVCPFLESQQLLYDKLTKYKPLILNGKTKNRTEIVEKFNQPNNKYRVIIITNTVGSEGISLHDTDGRFPRTMYIIPTHHFINVFQASGRTYRRGLMSNTEVYIVYSNHGVIESIIVHALAKTQIANLVLDDSIQRLYPGLYPYVIEDCKQKDKLMEILDNEKAKAEQHINKHL